MLQDRVKSGSQLSDEDESKKTQQSSGFLTDMMRFRFINQGLNAARGLAKSDNVFDSMGQMTDIASSVSEGLVETLVKGIGGIFIKGDNPLKRKLLDEVAKWLGTAAGTATGFAGDIVQRNVNAQNQYLQGYGSLRALTGRGLGVPDLSAYGYDFQDVQSTQMQAATRFGTPGLARNVTNTMLLERGLSLNRDTIYQLAEIQRGTGRDVLNTVGGILGSGLVKDRAFLGETLGKFIQLQTTFRESATNVSDRGTSDVLSMFNNVGGEFGINDSRSMANIGAIQSSIGSPSNDAMKAMSYLALRRLNPNAGIADLRMMQQGGLQTPGYFSSLLKQLEGMGGGEDFTRLSLEGLGISASAAKTLYKNRQSIYDGKIGQGDLTSILSDSVLRDEANKSTTQLDQNSALIKNSFVQGATDGIVELAKTFDATIRQIFGNTTIILSNGQLVTNGIIKTNITKTP